MRAVFDFADYKAWLKQSMQAKPQRGRGEISRIAEHLNVHVTLVSQILRGNKDFTIEQAHSITNYFGLSDLETQYFILLVQINRSGTQALKSFFTQQASKLKEQSLLLSKRLPVDHVLSTEEAATFYSSWIYSAVRVFCSIGDGKSRQQIRDHFQLTAADVNKVVVFLVSARLLSQTGDLFVVGPQLTHVGTDSPFLKSHLQNWRVKTLEAVHQLTEEEMMYSSCLSISRNDFALVRERFAQTVKEINNLVKNTSPEELVVFNLDWARLKV